MSKKDSSSKTAKDKKDKEVVVVDADEPVVLVDETGAREAAAPAADAKSDDPSDPGADAPAGASTESGSDGPGADKAEPGSEAAAEGKAEPAAGAADEEKSGSGKAGKDKNASRTHETGKGKAGSGSDAATVDKSESGPGADSAAGDSKLPPAGTRRQAGRPRRSWFGLFNFILILALAGGAGYYWWLEQQLLRDYDNTIADLEQRLEAKAGSSRLDSSLSALESDIGGLRGKIGELETEQQGLRESSEKLYELFGRDRADWQLAEVEYLMRVAQHKLILEDDFAGAAATLQAASDRIAKTGDPGLLPVRVTISEEIAELKTRERPDLVGITLILGQLARQVRTLEPGFAPRVDDTGSGLPQVQPPEDWRDRITRFLDSLVEVRHESAAPTEIEASVANVGETLEDNLKLARWAVLDRDARQYADLIDQSVRLVREFYDLDNAANHDFLSQLQTLQKTRLEPEKPDITGSLRQLQRILSERENAPESEPGESSDG